jgi:signal transduction histidine kinase
MLHRFRVEQVAKTLKVRFEERLAERTRVAQILHDTLLQGVISASMQLHVVAEQVPPDSPAHEPLQRVLKSMSQVVDEGRNTLRGLQSSSDGLYDLEHFISGVSQELDFQGDIRVIVKGKTLPLRSTLRRNLYSIGRDALALVFQEPRARNVSVELRYTASELRVIIRHNGDAVDPNALHEACDRAERTGARLQVRKSLLYLAQNGN